jgi:hydroxymethylbilane synthase
MKQSKKFSINTGARSSPLSRAQVEEIASAMPAIDFQMHWVETTGDKDLVTSLRGLEKTDFFTRELDEMVLQKKVRIAIHSAKDLPDPLPHGLRVAHITKGIDPRDCLVLARGESLREGLTIATSSQRREEAVRALVKNVRFVDLRGTIGQRLSKLGCGEVDGVVVAAAALIRLKLLDLNFFYLPGPTAAGQGQLALVCRDDDEEMIRLFSCTSSI